jgi:hypothetical protein
MSGAGGTSTQNQQQSAQTQLPAWVNKAGQQNYEYASEIANRPHTPYGGTDVAAIAPETYDAWNFAKSNVGAYQPAYDAALGAAGSNAGFNPLAVNPYSITPRSVAGADLTPYLNPYTEEVINKSIADAERSGALAQNAITTGATKSGGGFGTRQAVQQGVTAGETARNVGELGAGLRSKAYDTATGLLQGDINRELAAGTTNLGAVMEAQRANQAADISGAGIRGTAGTSLANIADQARSGIYGDTAQLTSIGQQAQTQEQRALDELYSRFTEERDYPKENLNLLLSALGMTPYQKGTVGSAVTEKSATPDYATSGLGALNFLKGLGVFSEDAAKTDKELIGYDPVIELPLYAYRYKKDPKSYPKVIGPMASDIEKKYPEVVRRVGGKRVIDLTSVLEMPI